MRNHAYPNVPTEAHVVHEHVPLHEKFGGPFNYNPVISHFGFKALAELFKSLCENSLANLLEWLAVAAPHVRIQRSMGLDNSESRIQPKAQT